MYTPGYERCMPYVHPWVWWVYTLVYTPVYHPGYTILPLPYHPWVLPPCAVPDERALGSTLGIIREN